MNQAPNSAAEYVAAHATTPTVQLVKELEEQGHAVTKKFVSNVKWRLKRRATKADTGESESRKRASPYRPRKGTFSEFVCGLPFDVPADEVLTWGLEAGFRVTTVAAVNTARRKYANLRKRFGTGDAELILAQKPAARAKLIAAARARREKFEGEQQPRGRNKKRRTALRSVNESTDEPMVLATTSDAKSAAKQQLAALIVRVGLDEAEQVLAQFRTFTLATQ